MKAFVFNKALQATMACDQDEIHSSPFASEGFMGLAPVCGKHTPC